MTCAAAATPNAHTHQPWRRRARMWVPHTRRGHADQRLHRTGRAVQGVERPLAAVEQRVDQVGGAVAAQHLGVGQRHGQQAAADQHRDADHAGPGRGARRRAGRPRGGTAPSEPPRVV